MIPVIFLYQCPYYKQKTRRVMRKILIFIILMFIGTAHAYNDTALTIFESDMHVNRAFDVVNVALMARRRACPPNIGTCANTRRSLVVDASGGALFSDYSPANDARFRTRTIDFNIHAKAFVSDGATFGIQYTRTDTDTRNIPINMDLTGNSVTMFGQYLSQSGFFINAGINAGSIAWHADGFDDNDHNTKLWATQINTGMQFYLGQLSLTPMAGMRFMHVSSDAYTNLDIYYANWWYNNLQGSVGATVGLDFMGTGFVVRPTVSAGAIYDIISHGTSGVHVVSPSLEYDIPVYHPARSAFTAGAGIEIYGARFVTSLDYSVDVRTDYVVQSGTLHAKIAF